jgi:hypothetical protein
VSVSTGTLGAGGRDFSEVVVDDAVDWAFISEVCDEAK